MITFGFGKFGIVHRSVITAAITPRAFRVYVALCTFADNESGECYPSQGTIGAVCGISQPSASVAIKELESVGLVKKIYRKRDDGGDTSCCYLLTPPRIGEFTEGYFETKIPGDDETKIPGVFRKQNTINYSEELTTQKNYLAELPKKAIGGLGDLPEEYATDDVRNALNEYLQYRKARRLAKLLPVSWERNFAQWQRSRVTAADIIAGVDATIASGWQKLVVKPRIASEIDDDFLRRCIGGAE